MKESALWTSLRNGAKNVLWTRIESSAGAGVFDVNGLTLGGVSFWIELKIMSGNRIEFQKTQVAWAHQRLKYGAKDLFVLARKDNDLYLLDGKVTQQIPNKVYDRTVSIAPDDDNIIVIYRKPFDWDDLLKEVVAHSTRK